MHTSSAHYFWQISKVILLLFLPQKIYIVNIFSDTPENTVNDAKLFVTGKTDVGAS